MAMKGSEKTTDAPSPPSLVERQRIWTWWGLWLSVLVLGIAVSVRFEREGNVGTRTEEGDVRVVHVGNVQWKLEGVERQRRIIGLVELRNVERVLPFFLGALSEVVDGIVLLDDHSEDRTVELARSLGESGKAKVELIVRKKGRWAQREEMRDRNLLLKYGREVGGTHFVLLDYDEFFAAPCVKDGSLRSAILDLSPGEGLSLPWYEAWKSTRWHRVQRNDPSMNFLRRRQVVVFADDGKVEYETATTLSRELGDPSATIHTLRCPRNLCGSAGHVQTSSKWEPDKCGIVEMRFVNLDNVILKSAWYEALGRRANVPDDVVRGKMMDFLFTESHEAAKKQEASDEVMRQIPPSFLEYSSWRDDLYNVVETWRAEEVLRWGIEYQSHGGLQALISNLPASSSIQWDLLEHALAERPAQSYLSSLPRRRKRRLRLLLLPESVPAELEAYILLLLGQRKSCKAVSTKSFVTLVDRLQAEHSVRMTKDLTACSIHGLDAVRDWTDLAVRAFSDMHVDFVVLRGLHTATKTSNDDLAEFERVIHHIHSWVEDHFHLRLLEIDALESIRLQNAVEMVSVCDKGPRSVGRWREVITAARLARNSIGGPKIGRMIFSINAGRSGSKYLAGLLATARNNILAIHEQACPKKECTSGGAMRMQDVPLETSYARRRDVKVPMILDAIAGYMSEMLDTDGKGKDHSATVFVTEVNSTGRFEHRGGGSDVVFAETNPNFKSWFYDIVFREFVDDFHVTLVVLQKWLPALLRSLYETGFFSTRDGYQWMETANSINAHVAPIAPDAELTPLEILISYILNTEAFTRDLITSPEAKKVHFVFARSEAIFSEEGGLRLFQELELHVTEETRSQIGQYSDKYLDQDHQLRKHHRAGKIRVLKISLQECIAVWEVYQWRAQQSNLPIKSVVDRFPAFNYRS